MHYHAKSDSSVTTGVHTCIREPKIGEGWGSAPWGRGVADP